MPTRVGDVKAADPGIGFTLNFDSPLGSTLRVVITMTDLQQPKKGNYTSEVILNNSISDTELVFVVPFGDDNYAPSNCLSFKIELYTPKNPVEKLTGVVMGEKGSFSFSTSVPTTIKGILQTGDMLQSEDGSLIGVYQKDGNFCVYPQFADNQSGLNVVYSTHSDIGQPTIFYINGLNNGMNFISIFTPDFSKIASQSNPFLTQSNNIFSINSIGSLCINGTPLSFTKA